MALKTERKWLRIARGDVCPICGSKDWCGLSADGAVVRCMRVESDKPSTARDGTTGWIHSVDRNLKAPRRERPVKAPAAKIDDVPALAAKMARAPGAVQKRGELSRQWLVSVAALEEMGVGIGWGPDEPMREFASFPSRDGEGSVVGITRRYSSGAKLTYPGTSNAGVFCCARWWMRMGPVFVVEGASDVLALHTANLAVVGRPSNVAGAPVLVRMFERHELLGRTIVVVCEDDRKSPEELAAKKNPQPHPDDCAGCARCWPGEFGARSVLEQLTRAGYGVEYVRPLIGYKDTRQMWMAGVLGDWLDACGLSRWVGYDHEAWHRLDFSRNAERHSASKGSKEVAVEAT